MKNEIDFYENPIHIVATQYVASTKSLDLYLSGCNAPHCKKCHNPLLFEFGNGEIINKEYINKIIEKIKDFDLLIESIFFYGGEPLDQNIRILNYFLEQIRNKTRKVIWVFTKYSLEEIPECIKRNVDYIKCGRFLEEYLDDNYYMFGIKLATTNQRIFKIEREN